MIKQYNKKFGSALSWARKQRGIKPSRLSELVGLNITTIYRYESGADVPSTSTFRSICNALKVEPFLIYYLASDIRENAKLDTAEVQNIILNNNIVAFIESKYNNQPINI